MDFSINSLKIYLLYSNISLESHLNIKKIHHKFRHENLRKNQYRHLIFLFICSSIYSILYKFFILFFKLLFMVYFFQALVNDVYLFYEVYFKFRSLVFFYHYYLHNYKFITPLYSVLSICFIFY